MACCVLHNIALARKQPLLDENFREIPAGELIETMQPPTEINRNEALPQQELRLRRLGQEKRAQIVSNVFGL